LADKSKDKFFWADPRNQTAFPVAKAGLPFIYASAFVTIVFALIGLVFPALVGILVTFCICGFFRDPDRVTPDMRGAVISPADGRVVSANIVETNPFIEGPCVKIGIFMSVFNVHVNRIPYSGSIQKILYFPGKFYTAGQEKASIENEHNAIILETSDHRKIGFVQVAGLIARRIICGVQEGDNLTCGQRFGLICFGSRVDVYLPSDTSLNVAKGDRVKAGTSIIGYLS
jgi:phosphatidylserine decarboxylase